MVLAYSACDIASGQPGAQTARDILALYQAQSISGACSLSRYRPSVALHNALDRVPAST